MLEVIAVSPLENIRLCLLKTAQFPIGIIQFGRMRHGTFSDFFNYVICLMTTALFVRADPFKTYSASGRKAHVHALLHRLNRPLHLMASNSSRNSSFLNHTKPSLPVFNYGGSNFIGRENELGFGGNGTEGSEEQDGLDVQRQMLTALPDLSDPCFRRYANSIIVNAQPYERRSSISLIHCKLQCLRSQLGLYSCRSFVYDNVNQVCDLFAHVGDQSPARLLRFQTRDYFEPTAAIHCVPPPSAPSIGTSEPFAPAMGVQQQTQVPPAMPAIGQTPLPAGMAQIPTLVTAPIVWQTPTPTTIAATTPKPAQSTTGELGEEGGEEEEDNEEAGTGLTLLKPEEEDGDEDSGSEELQQRLEGAKQHSSSDGGQNSKGCLAGQVARFLRTKDFELFGQDQHRMVGVQSEQRCIELCVQQGNASVQCNSLEYTPAHEECVFSTETAVPVGNGQLRQRPGTDYLERVCVDQKLASECRSTIYRRFPQMILVGFAETVVDSASLQQCLDNCLNSQQLYGFRCSSGMFYFEEPQLNCILNTEDRESQPDLFTTETSDLVDYFETGCAGARLAPKSKPMETRDYEEETNESDGVFRKHDFVERTRRERLGWTQWTVCTARAQWTTIGTQARWRVCVGGRVCGKEERQCLLAGRKASGNSGTRPNSTPASSSPSKYTQRQPKRDQRRVATVSSIGQKMPSGHRPMERIGPSAASSGQMPQHAMSRDGRERVQPRRCRSEECCPLLGSCRLGIRFGPQGQGANWCKNPCG